MLKSLRSTKSIGTTRSTFETYNSSPIWRIQTRRPCLLLMTYIVEHRIPKSVSHWTKSSPQFRSASSPNYPLPLPIPRFLLPSIPFFPKLLPCTTHTYHAQCTRIPNAGASRVTSHLRLSSTTQVHHHHSPRRQPSRPLSTPTGLKRTLSRSAMHLHLHLHTRLQTRPMALRSRLHWEPPVGAMTGSRMIQASLRRRRS